MGQVLAAGGVGGKQQRGAPSHEQHHGVAIVARSAAEQGFGDRRDCGCGQRPDRRRAVEKGTKQEAGARGLRHAERREPFAAHP